MAEVDADTRRLGAASGRARWWPSWLCALAAYAAVVLVLYGDLLVDPSRVVSEAGADISEQWIHWLDLGFGELGRGNLVQWNPYVFSGNPFFAAWQPALLYPPNALCLVLPVGLAINFLVAAHVLLGGLFAYLWLARRGASPLGAWAGGLVWMLAGAAFQRIVGGHFTTMSVLAWSPAVLAAIDDLLERATFRWALGGAMAVALQLLAGCPQHVFFAGVGAGIYVLLRLPHAPRRWRSLLAVGGLYLGGLALAAAQVLPGLALAQETTRAGGLPYETAARFSLPPEALLSLVTPWPFGGVGDVPYWGRWFQWETSSFVGVAALALVVWGARRGDPAITRRAGIVACVLAVLAFGSGTPLYGLLYAYVPGFRHLRGLAKFNAHAVLFLAPLVAAGLDAFARRGASRGDRLALAGVAVAAAAAALLLHAEVLAAPWQAVVAWVRGTGETMLSGADYGAASFAAASRAAIAASLFVTAGAAAGMALALRRPRPLPAVVALVVVELVVVARATRATFEVAATRPSPAIASPAGGIGDGRIVSPGDNTVITARVKNVYGYDPIVLRRYAEFVAISQGFNPDRLDSDLPLLRAHPLFALLRARLAIMPSRQGPPRQVELTGALPHLLLVSGWRQAEGRDAVFHTMATPDFNPGAEAVLEAAPDPAPVAGGRRGTVRLLGESTDHLDIEANLPDAALLVVTDAWAEGWAARPLPGSSASAYRVMPADWVLRAIPLAAGHHRLRLEYVPRGFRAGVVTSLAAGACWLALAAWVVARLRRAKRLARQP